jgi:PAS domain S-box-containing protein
LGVTGELADQIARDVDAPVVRLEPASIVPDGIALAALVFDLRSYDVPMLAELRARPGMAELPLLLVSTTEIPESFVEILDATDGLVVTRESAATARRRVALVLETGRSRAALSVATQVVEQGTSGLSIVDAERPGAPLVFVSASFERLSGYPASEVVGEGVRFLHGLETDRAVGEELRAAIAERRATSLRVRAHRRVGLPHWCELTVFPVWLNGRASRWVAIVHRDVSELAELRARIDLLYQESFERQRFAHAVLDGVDVGIVTTDDAGLVTFVNRFATKRLGLGATGPGRRVEELLQLDRWGVGMLGSAARRTFAHPFRLPSGDELDLEVSLSRSDEETGADVRFFFIFRDVGEEKRREEERRRFERLAAMGTMVAGFAHEVRNPIAAMRSIAEELLEELADPTCVRHVGLLLQMIERIERLVRTSLQFGRPAAPRRARQRPWVIVSHAVAELGPRLRALGDDLAIDVEPDLPDVFVDERQLTQTLAILLSNALDATGAASRVALRVCRARPSDVDPRPRRSEPPPPNGVRFEVVDDGPGVSEENLGRIFDPFFTTKPSGTGLGLSIAQHIVAENGGRLEVSSAPGGPTKFTVWVPSDGAGL